MNNWSYDPGAISAAESPPSIGAAAELSERHALKSRTRSKGCDLWSGTDDEHHGGSGRPASRLKETAGVSHDL
jgi:hypothetical protein